MTSLLDFIFPSNKMSLSGSCIYSYLVSYRISLSLRDCKLPSGPYQNLVSHTLLTTCLLLVSCLLLSSALKMEAVHSSEIPVGFYWTTQSYIPNSTFQNICSLFIWCSDKTLSIPSKMGHCTKHWHTRWNVNLNQSYNAYMNKFPT
jgi:hypothetical protein